MCSGSRSFIVSGFTLLACLGPGVHFSEGQQIRVESFFPRQLPLGQATVVSVAVTSRDTIQAAEISPSLGVQVSGIKLGQNFQGAMTWSELTIDVGKDAAPGNRALVLLMPMGRTAPVTVMIPSHVPSISELRILSAQSNQPTFALQFAAVDGSADLGDSPYVWFTIGCDGELVPGVVRGELTARDKANGVVHAVVPNPRTPAGGDTPASSTSNKCDLQVRVSDSGGIDSNTLKTTVDFKN
jgi:hypothetical protein